MLFYSEVSLVFRRKDLCEEKHYVGVGKICSKWSALHWVRFEGGKADLWQNVVSFTPKADWVKQTEGKV